MIYNTYASLLFSTVDSTRIDPHTLKSPVGGTLPDGSTVSKPSFLRRKRKNLYPQSKPKASQSIEGIELKIASTILLASTVFSCVPVLYRYAVLPFSGMNEEEKETNEGIQAAEEDDGIGGGGASSSSSLSTTAVVAARTHMQSCVSLKQ